ncbi:hypothetical protein BGZ80_005408 [Entomortierella chlamydospora]|uniref:Uncharacterized protein n=1 Tax=Entomortierella chlamydospora TaxID=101097 RepID=A0A9P6MKX5_9FUNG|nr:hypothetical protein BGZ80_005408 [Entomortierella chlamydospora]
MASWKTFLSSMEIHGAYFDNITDPQDISPKCFFEALHVPAEKEWEVIMRRLAESGIPALMRTAKRLQMEWRLTKISLNSYWSNKESEENRENFKKSNFKYGTFLHSQMQKDVIDVLESEGKEKQRTSPSQRGRLARQLPERLDSEKNENHEDNVDESSSTQTHEQSKSGKRQKIAQIFKLSANKIASTTYFKNEEDIGDKFFRLQLDGVDLVNDPSVMATSENLFCFLYGQRKDTIEKIRAFLMRTSFRFPQDDQLLLSDLEQDLKSNLRQIRIGMNYHQQIVIHIFASLMYSLPATYFSFKQDLEDTFVHKTLNALFSTIFALFDLEWANKHAEGSRERRKDGLKPDLQLDIGGRTVLFLEVKPPGPVHHESDYLSDKWKLLNLAKDEIDRNLRRHFHMPFIVTIQVFGEYRNLLIYYMGA